MVAQATPQAIPPEKIKVRDVRYPKHFWADNELVDQYLPGIGANAFAVYMVLCRFANNQTGKCDPSITTLMEKLNLSRNTVKRNLKILQSHELIQIEIRKRGKVNDTHEYTLLSIKEKPGVGQQVTEVGQELTEGRSTGDRGVGQQVTPNKTQEEQDSKNKTHFGETLPRSPDTAHTEIKSEPVKAEPKQPRYFAGQSVNGEIVPEFDSSELAQVFEWLNIRLDWIRDQQPILGPSSKSYEIWDRENNIKVWERRSPYEAEPPIQEPLIPLSQPEPEHNLVEEFRESWRQAMTGQTRPIDELLQELKEESQPEPSGLDSAVLNVKGDIPRERANEPEPPAAPDLPPVPEGYEAIYMHVSFGYWRHYREKGRKKTLCGSEQGEMRGSGWTGTDKRDTQCPTCAAKLAERQAKAAARAEKAAAKKPKYLQPPDELKDAWAKILHGGKEGMTGHNWNTLVKLWNELKCPDIEASRKFWKYWYKHDWRGIQGQRPMYGQVISLWPTAQNWTNGTPNLDEPASKEEPYSFFFSKDAQR